MSDTGIFFLKEDGRDWAEFLRAKFDEQEISSSLENDENVNERLVNVILVTPVFLDASINPNIMSMDPDRTIAVLLGVEEKDVRTHSNEAPWRFFEMLASDESVTTLTKLVQDLLRDVKQESETNSFSVLPASITSDSADSQDHVDWQDPDPYHVLPPPRPTELNGSRKSVLQLQVATAETESGIDVFLLTNRKGSNDIEVVFTEPKSQGITTAGCVDLAAYILHVTDPSCFDCQQTFVQTSEETSISLHGTIPAVPQITAPEKYTPSKQDIIRQVLGFEEDPLPIACQCFNLEDDSNFESNNDLFDNYISSCFHKHRDTKVSQWSTQLQTDLEGSGKYPTLLHFAAEHNLPCLTNDLLEIPDIIYACFKMNSDKETPQMIAHRNDYKEVYHSIKSLVKREKVLGKAPNVTDSGIIDDNKLETIYELHMDKTEKGLKKTKSGLWSRLLIPKIRKTRKKYIKDGVDVYGTSKSMSRSNSISSESDDILRFRASMSSAPSVERCESGYYEQPKHDEIENQFDEETNSKEQSHGKGLHLSKSARF